MSSNPKSLQLANPMHDIITHERAGMVSENRQQESIRQLLQCSMFDYYGLGHFPKLTFAVLRGSETTQGLGDLKLLWKCFWASES